MKPTLLLAFVTLAATAWCADAAPTDHSYYVTEMAPQLKFDVYNDGHNTYLESIPGLVVTGATADGERYIVAGVPEQIRGFMNGKPITVLRGVPPAPKPAPAPKADPAAINVELKRLKDELASLSAKAPKPTPAPSASAAAVPSALAAAPMGDKTASASPQGAAPGAQHASAKNDPAKVAYVTAKDVRVYQVTPYDQNLRLLIENWSKVVGWNFLWDVDRDIPVSGADAKENDFKSAVRRVLAATDFGDLPVKPCFYSNDFLRVVPKTTKCNPNE